MIACGKVAPDPTAPPKPVRWIAVTFGAKERNIVAREARPGV